MTARTPTPWAMGLVFNANSPRPNTIVWSVAKSPRAVVARDVATSDAALICAAPDLLALLKEAVEEMPLLPNNPGQDRWFKAAYAVISKAGGK